MPPETPRRFQFTLRKALLALAILSPCMIVLSAIVRAPGVWLIPLALILALPAAIAAQAAILVVLDYLFGLLLRRGPTRDEAPPLKHD